MRIEVVKVALEQPRVGPNGNKSLFADILVCDLEVSVSGASKLFEGVRLDNFMSQVVESFISLNFVSDTSYLHLEGYNCYLRMDGRDPVVTTFSCDSLPANRTEFTTLNFAKFLKSILFSAYNGICSLGLSDRDMAEIRQTFRFGWVLIADLPVDNRLDD